MKSHIIPTFILKGFTEDTKDKSSHLFLYRKDLNKIKKKHPNNCFWEEDYFISPRIDENDRGNDSKEVENKLSGLESKMADLVKKMSEINNDNSIHLNTKERDTLILFFVSMDRRNRYSQQESRDFSNNSLSQEENVEEWVKDYIHEYNQQDKDSEEYREFLSFCIKNSPKWELEEGKKTLKGFHTEEETKNRLAQELHSLMNNPDDLDESLYYKLLNRGVFSFLHNESGNFIVGDCGVIKDPPYFQKRLMKTNLYLPISQNIIIRWRENGMQGRIHRMNRQKVLRLNNMCFEQSIKEVAGSSKGTMSTLLTPFSPLL